MQRIGLERVGVIFNLLLLSASSLTITLINDNKIKISSQQHLQSKRATLFNLTLINSLFLISMSRSRSLAYLNYYIII